MFIHNITEIANGNPFCFLSIIMYANLTWQNHDKMVTNKIILKNNMKLK